MRVIQLEEGDRLVGIAKLAESDEGEEEPQAALPGAEAAAPKAPASKPEKKSETSFLVDDDEDDE